MYNLVKNIWHLSCQNINCAWFKNLWHKSFGWLADGARRRSCIRVSKANAVKPNANEWWAATSVAISEQNRRLKDRREIEFRMVGRAVECGGLENRCGGNSTGGSNPSPSASILGYTVSYIKSPQFRGIFHALTMVYAKNAPFYAIIFRFLYNPRFPIVNGQVIDFSN